MSIVEIFTDGACSGNPGPGGWGALLRFNGVEKQISGFESNATNNQMELKAAIEGLKALKRPSTVVITTDSVYVKNGITNWIFGWKKKNWKNSAGKDVKNKELWQELEQLVSKQIDVKWEWVKGHSGHRENEIADLLATSAIENSRGNI